eukprot:CAMPEP_0176286930 /NCGR_PEP_ID=MMETSP0121_2-20121125/53167_1 /TAXON_ID=160619 /ORGANISM="Kryptoperidinium foliaceum, Strain CCMP 1326" /LENGTH=45 /DNA_ID= /DNA_START= /DNA_END= /DNA_ORIENTATION=
MAHVAVFFCRPKSKLCGVKRSRRARWAKRSSGVALRSVGPGDGGP